MKKSKILAATLISLLGLCTSAKTISNETYFYRCYRQLTQNFPKPNHPLVVQVKSGQITPVDACMQVFDKALFTNNGVRIQNTGDDEAIAVLRTMHSLHFSWQAQKNFSTLNSYNKAAKSFLDITSPALYMTKALFAPNYQVKNIFIGKLHYEGDREDNDPAISASNEQTKSQYPNIHAPWNFAEKGQLFGVHEYLTKKVKVNVQAGSQRVDVNMNWDMHLGGGILGSHNYIALNLDTPTRYRADGAKIMPRKWARSIFTDYLCREIPVIRYEDASPYIVEESPTEFRTDGACLRCHTSIDQTSGVVRNSYTVLRLLDAFQFGASRLMEVQLWPVNQPPESSWPHTPDVDYYRRPANGRFVYRTHNGQKIDRNLTSAEDLGQILAELDDSYICMAKKYYQYFTGVESNVDDIGDPQYGKTLNTGELAHRNEVVDLGKSLKSHQSLRQLVKDIISKPIFRDSAYKLPQ